MNDKILISFRCDKSVRDTFQKLYPANLSKFLTACLKRGITDKEFTLTTLFSEVK